MWQWINRKFKAIFHYFYSSELEKARQKLTRLDVVINALSDGKTLQSMYLKNKELTPADESLKQQKIKQLKSFYSERVLAQSNFNKIYSEIYGSGINGISNNQNKQQKTKRNELSFFEKYIYCSKERLAMLRKSRKE